MWVWSKTHKHTWYAGVQKLDPRWIHRRLSGMPGSCILDRIVHCSLVMFFFEMGGNPECPVMKPLGARKKTLTYSKLNPHALGLVWSLPRMAFVWKVSPPIQLFLVEFRGTVLTCSWHIDRILLNVLSFLWQRGETTAEITHVWRNRLRTGVPVCHLINTLPPPTPFFPNKGIRVRRYHLKMAGTVITLCSPQEKGHNSSKVELWVNAKVLLVLPPRWRRCKWVKTLRVVHVHAPVIGR